MMVIRQNHKVVTNSAIEDQEEVMRLRLMDILHEVTGIPLETMAAPELSLIEIGLNSLMAIEYRIQIQETFGIRLPTRFDFPSLASLARYILSLSPASQLAPILHSPVVKKPENDVHSSALIRIRSTGSARPLFFFPCGYGIGNCYIPLAKYIVPDVPLYALNDPQLHHPENAFKSIPEYARALVEIIREVQPAGPYRFCGYCFGGTLALSAASQLMESGEEIESVTLLDTLYPSLYVRWIVALNKALANYMIKGETGNVLSTFGSSVLFEALNSEFLSATFKPPKYTGHVTFVKARAPLSPLGSGPEHDTLQGHLHEFHEAPLLGWENSLSSITLYSVNSTHFSMLDEVEVVFEIGQILNRILRNGKVGHPREEQCLDSHVLFAAKNNESFLVEKLLTVLKLDPNYCDPATKWTPLHWAVKNGNMEMVDVLLRAGADKQIKNIDGKTPLELIGKQLKNLLEE